jgi:hypothetical protein
MTQQTMTRPEIVAADGSSVGLRPGAVGEVLETKDARGRVLFEYDPASNRAVVRFPGTGLEIQAVDGRVELVCENGLTIRSGGTVEIASERGVKLASEKSTLSVEPERVSTESAAAEVRVGEAKVACGKLEQTIGRVISWVKASYQRVEELLHVRAGRIRTETAGQHLVQADQARIQAEGDVHLQGRSINLG